MNAAKHLIDILNYLVAEREPLGVTEISKSIGSNKSSIYRILSTLKNAQWVDQDPITKKYTLGMGLQELGVSIVSRLNLRNVSLPYLSELSNVTGETAMLTARVGYERIYVEQIESSHDVRQIVEIGKRYPLWAGAPGKVILANLETGEIRGILNDLLKSGKLVLASGETLEIDRLKRELEETKRQGFCITVSERVVFTAAVAAPIFSRNNQVIGAISMGGPIPRFNAELAAKYAPLVSKAANEISLRLGYSSDDAKLHTKRNGQNKRIAGTEVRKVSRKTVGISG